MKTKQARPLLSATVIAGGISRLITYDMPSSQQRVAKALADHLDPIHREIDELRAKNADLLKRLGKIPQ